MINVKGIGMCEKKYCLKPMDIEAYAGAKAEGGSVIEALGAGRIVAIEALSSGEVVMTDSIDGCFGVRLGRDELKALAQEIDALADREIGEDG